jgi:hypothetical protein
MGNELVAMAAVFHFLGKLVLTSPMDSQPPAHHGYRNRILIAAMQEASKTVSLVQLSNFTSDC